MVKWSSCTNSTLSFRFSSCWNENWSRIWTTSKLMASSFFFRIHVFILGNNRRRQSLCWFSWYFIHWNIIQIFAIRSRSFYTYSSWNLWYVSWRTYTCSEWVCHFIHWLYFILILFRWDGVKAGPKAPNTNHNQSIDIVQNVQSRKSGCC